MTGTWSDWFVALAHSQELSLVLKATLTLTLGLAAAWLTRHARASVRHLVLASALLALLVLPLAFLVVPAVSIEVPVTGADVLGTAPATSAASASRTGTASAAAGSTTRANDAVVEPASAASARPGAWSLTSWRTAALAVWALGALALLTSLGAALWRLERMRRHALPSLDARALVSVLAGDAGLRRPVTPLLHEDLDGPLAFGLLHPTILLPADAPAWREEDLRRALVHELEHVRRRDWAIQLLAHVVCALYWFHPLVWIARRHLCLEAERACDDAVVQSAEETAYAEQLVALARRLSGSVARPALGMANRTDLAMRVFSILDGTRRRGRIGMRHAAAAAIATAVAVLAIAPVRAVGVQAGGDSKPKAAAAKSSAEPAKPGDAPRSGRARAFGRALYEASAEGDVDAIAGLLDAGADVNSVISGDGSPLIAAARKGHLPALKLLLDRGADPDLAVPGDGNALIAAASAGQGAAMALLLDRGASVDLVVPGDENALITASGSGRLDVVQLLVERGADVSARAWAGPGLRRPEGEWRTPLGQAQNGRHQLVIEYLQSKGAQD